MAVVIVASLVVLLGVTGILAWLLHRVALEASAERAVMRAEMDTEREAWAVERSELLNRIQHPQRPIPARRQTTTPRPDREPDQSHLVGAVMLPEPDRGDG